MARSLRFLIAPTGGRGEGAGHLVRSVQLAGDLGRCDLYGGFLDPPARVLLGRLLRPGGGGDRRKDRGRDRDKAWAGGPAEGRPRVLRKLRPQETWNLVILDKRRTTFEELRGLERLGPVVCLDEGGEARSHASYLIDTIPRLPGDVEANVASLSFLDLPPRVAGRRSWPPRRILVSFGAEDARDLTGSFLAAVIEARLLSPDQITVLEGPLSSARRRPEGVRVLKPGAARRVRELFPANDLLVTHFGITALEALAHGLPIVLLNPSSYHRKLARLLGIPEIGIGNPDIRRLRELLSRRERVACAVDRFQATLERADQGTLARYLRLLAGGAGGATGPDCPACGGRGPVVARFPLRTWRRCESCQVEYLESFSRRRDRYSRGYFLEEYRAQYGLTYLDDFESIKEMGRQRIRIMEELMGSRATRRGAVVDIGCAYGPFLDALRDAGWPCFGVDVAADAILHVEKRLGLPAVRSSLERLRRRDLPARVEAIALWYVIEHLDNLGGALRKLAGFLDEGGILALSTPNGRGISALADKRAFLQASPEDHRTVLTASSLRKLLERHGFRLRRVRVTGHHPERFPGALGKAASSHPFIRVAFGSASRLFGLGDTFEAYAERTG